RDLDSLADVFEGVVYPGLHPFESFHLLGRIGDAPIQVDALLAWLAVGDQSELEAPDRVSDVERLIEVRLLAEKPGIPGLAPLEVRNGVDGGAQASNHGGLLKFDRFAASSSAVGFARTGDVVCELRREDVLDGDADRLEHRGRVRRHALRSGEDLADFR